MKLPLSAQIMIKLLFFILDETDFNVAYSFCCSKLLEIFLG